MQENIEKYLTDWHQFTDIIIENPKGSLVSFKKSLNPSNIDKFEQFFSGLEKNYPQSAITDKISLLFLSANFASYYYEVEKGNPSKSDKEGLFTEKMQKFHQILCLDNGLSDASKAKLSVLVGYTAISIEFFLLATFFYIKAINFEKKALTADTSKNLTNYYLSLSLAYFKHGSMAKKNLSFKAESEIYHKAINAAKEAIAQNRDNKKSEAWFHVTRATYSLAVLHYEQKNWNKATQLLNDLILASLAGLKTPMNSEKQIGVFLGYIINSLNLIPGLLKQGIVEKESRQAVKETITALKTRLLDLSQEHPLLSQAKEKIYPVESSLLNSHSTEFFEPILQSVPSNEGKSSNIQAIPGMKIH